MPGKSHGPRSLVGYSPWGRKESDMTEWLLFTSLHEVFRGLPGGSMVKNLPAKQETWIRSLGKEDPLEKEMATHSSIFAWKIPWTGELGRLQSTGSQRVGHNWETKQQHEAFTNSRVRVFLMTINICIVILDFMVRHMIHLKLTSIYDER